MKVHITERTRKRESGPLLSAAYSEMVATAHSLWPDAVGIAKLPSHFADGLIQVTRNVTAGVPDSALTARERTAMALPPALLPNSSPNRHELIFLPVERGQGSAYLDTTVLHQTTRRAVANLAWELLCNDPARSRGNDGSHRLLLRAIQQALSRGYADGFKHVLGRHVPDIFDHPRIRSGPRIPWVLVLKKDGTAHTVRTAWTRRRAWDSAYATKPNLR